MTKRDSGIALAVIGTIVLILAVLAYAYTEFGEEFVPGTNGSEPHYRGLTIAPYIDYALPLALVGIILFFVSFFILIRNKH